MHKLVILFVFALSGCDQSCESDINKYSISSGADGKLIRLNTETGETCIIGENCDLDLTNLKIGENYDYIGNGVFKKPDYSDFEIIE